MSGERFGPRFTGLSGLPPQFEVRSEGEKWKGAFEATREVASEQGQVMVAALDNNRNLWNTNKLLRQQLKEMGGRVLVAEDDSRTLRKRLEQLTLELETLRNRQALIGDLVEREQLQEGNVLLLKQNKQLLHALTLMQYPELSQEQRREKLAELKAQAKELAESGLIPTQEQLDAHDRKLDAKALASARPRGISQEDAIKP